MRSIFIGGDTKNWVKRSVLSTTWSILCGAADLAVSKSLEHNRSLNPDGINDAWAYGVMDAYI
jgi:hypothetical protein